MTPDYGYNLDHAKLCVGKGWHPLLDLAYRMRPNHVRVAEVKQKYGALRMSSDGAPAWYEDLLWEIEQVSFTVCEECGRAGRARGGGWIRTLCDECEKERRG